jgi:Core-2/I-Branching enzyme
MKIAYLVLCHTDPDHITRLANKLTIGTSNHVFIHVDLNTDIEIFKSKLFLNSQVHFIDQRVNVYWGGFSSIIATYKLMKESYYFGDFERFVVLQGLDYPLASNKNIESFFIKHSETEFIRACNVSISKNEYLYAKARYFLFFDRPNFIKKIANKFTRTFKLKFKAGFFYHNQKKYLIYWGSAQWALTRGCIKYLIDFEHFEHINSYFYNIFPADEVYFQTLIFNSCYSEKTTFGGPELEKVGLTNWRNVHYFEYKKNIKVFSELDYELLKSRHELYVRKVNSSVSHKLLDMIDKSHLEQKI